jgi:hypothetical protein
MQIPGNSFVLSGLIQAIDLMLVKPILGALPWSSALQAAHLSLEPQPMDIAQSCPMFCISLIVRRAVGILPCSPR